MRETFAFMALKWISFCAWAPSLCVFIANAVETNSPAGKANVAADPDFKRFIAEKRSLVTRLSEKHEDSVPDVVWSFFDAAQNGDWDTTSNLFYKIEAGTARRSKSSWMPISLWAPIHETFGAYEQFHSWSPQLIRRFGNTIIQKIPAGSVYFGGTDSGRFVVSALCASHTEGRPFFTITQNALADGSYLAYLHDIYGTKIYVPTTEDSQQVFKDFLADAQKRKENNQLKEGEHVEIVNDRVQVSGLAAVMSVNELLAKLIIEKNPSHEIYLEQSYSLESLYDQSVPHGLVFKVNHEKMQRLSKSVIEADHKFWTAECKSLIGNVVKQRTSVKELCSSTEKMFMHPKSGNSGVNWEYVKDMQAPKYWSMCRSAIAGYYEWWAKNSEKAQRSGLNEEADFAFRQSIALFPFNPAIVWRYTQFLLANQRTNDAKILVEATLRMEPEKRMEIDSDQLKDALNKLQQTSVKLSGKKE